jgi:hypothetical protein
MNGESYAESREETLRVHQEGAGRRETVRKGHRETYDQEEKEVGRAAQSAP